MVLQPGYKGRGLILYEGHQPNHHESSPRPLLFSYNVIGYLK